MEGVAAHPGLGNGIIGPFQGGETEEAVEDILDIGWLEASFFDEAPRGVDMRAATVGAFKLGVGVTT
jgi:hypothetical protein